MRVRTLRLAQPPGIRSTGGLHVPIEADGTKTDDEFDFVSDAKKFHGNYKPKQAYVSLVSEIRAIVDQAREGALTYDEDSNEAGTVCQIHSQVGVLEARLESTSYGDKPLYVRLFFSEPEQVEMILLLGTLLKEDFPDGKEQQNRHAQTCQIRGDRWITSRTWPCHDS